MTTQIQRILNISIVLLSWLTLPLLGSRNIKRYLLSAILIFFVEVFHTQYGKKRRWWVFYNKPKSFLFGELPFEIGPFFVISMWLLKWSYGNLKLFIFLNSIVHALFAFPIAYLAKKYKYYTLVRLNNLQFFLYYFFKLFILYGFQYLFEKIWSETVKESI